MEFQQKEGYSPFAGCLPMLLQLPIIMFLYEIIRKPLSFICNLGEDTIVKIYRLVNDVAAETEVAFASIDQIGLVSKINGYTGDLSSLVDKSTIPDFTFFGLNLADTPNIAEPTLLVLIPILAAGLTWLSMWLTRKWNGNAMQTAGQDAQANASMKMMDLVMPAMTLFIAFGFSGMLGLYWIYQTGLGMLQSFILSRVMPLPKYTEEEIKGIAEFTKSLGTVDELHLLPYHRLGEDKYKGLGRTYELHGVDLIPDEKIQRFKKVVEETGLNCHIGG